ATTRIRGAEARQARRKELERTLRTPAVSFLKAGTRSTEAAETADALVALMEHDYQKAMSVGEAAVAKRPAAYDAQRIVAAADPARVRERIEKGDAAGVKSDLDLAKTAFARALEVGRSDVASLTGDCRRCVLGVEVASRTGAPGEAAFAEGEAACR